jgi:hypothetical protein
MLLKDKYTIVMPIKHDCVGNHGSTFFEQIGRHTYEQFLDTTYLDRFIIICPKKDMDFYFDLLIDSKIPFDIISEESFLDKNVNNTDGWYKQQILKLTVSICINTPIYLVVDSDMYLNQSLSKNDLIHNSKYKYHSEPWQNVNNSLYSTNSNWWTNSCKILDVDTCIITSKTKLMSVTPQILVTTYVSQLIEHLITNYNQNWQRIISDMKFTEFTLYWVFCIIKNYTDCYTPNGYPIWSHDKNTNTLDPVKDYEYLDKIRESFLNPTSIFSVIQGYININPIEYMVSDIKTSLDWSKFRSVQYDNIVLIAAMTSPNRTQSFSVKERFDQTLQTIRSCKEKIPNAYIIFIEGSNIPSEYKTEFSRLVNHSMYLGSDKETQTYVNDHRNIGHGESYLLKKGIDFIKNCRIKSNNIIKLGARYRLNSDFCIKNFSTNKYTFRQHFDNSVNSNVYTTGLFSIPFSKIDEFQNILVDLQFNLSVKSSMVEKVYYDLIQGKDIMLIDNLGIEGELSYNKTFFKV